MTNSRSVFVRFNSLIKIIATLLVVISVLVWIKISGCLIIMIPFYGPLFYHPKFENGSWDNMSFVYHIVTDNEEHNEIECNVDIRGKRLEDLKKKFITQKSNTWSYGVDYQCKLSINQNEEYSFRFLSPDTFNFSKVGDLDMSSTVHLKNQDFYNAVKTYCFESARKNYPDIKISNIRLCERYTKSESIEPYKIEDIHKN